MNAAKKTDRVLASLQRIAPNATRAQAETLRRAELALQRWAEGECGDSGPNGSWAIERDDKTGKPYRVVYPNNGPSTRYPIPDRERGALARVAKVCGELGIHYYHQTDPRGCALYVDAQPLNAENYTRGVAVCA